MVIAPRPMRDTSRLARWAFFIVLTPVVQAWLVGMAHSSAMDERRGAGHHERDVVGDVFGLQRVGKSAVLQTTAVCGRGEVTAGGCTGSPPLGWAIRPPVFRAWTTVTT